MVATRLLAEVAHADWRSDEEYGGLRQLCTTRGGIWWKGGARTSHRPLSRWPDHQNLCAHHVIPARNFTAGDVRQLMRTPGLIARAGPIRYLLGAKKYYAGQIALLAANEEMHTGHS